MSDVQYITGVIKSAEELTSITGAQTFGGEDSQGFYAYSIKLNGYAGQRVRLLDSDQAAYDYVVDGSGGLAIRDDWVDDIQTEVYWDQVPVDTDVEVSNDNTNWTPMHFAEYDPSSPDGKYYYVWVDGRTSHSTIGGTEVFEVTMVAASSLNSKYFLIFSDTDTYYVWFNVGGTGNDPADAGGPIAGLGYLGAEVALDSTDTSSMVAIKTKVVVDGLADFLAIISPNNSSVVAIAASQSGNVYDAQPGNSGLTIEIKIQGGDKESYQYARIA
jgi:hypothetical protein